MVVSRALTRLRLGRRRSLWTGTFSPTYISGRNVGGISKGLGQFPVRNVTSTAPVSKAVGMTFLNKLFGRNPETQESSLEAREDSAPLSHEATTENISENNLEGTVQEEAELNVENRVLNGDATCSLEAEIETRIVEENPAISDTLEAKPIETESEAVESESKAEAEVVELEAMESVASESLEVAKLEPESSTNIQGSIASAPVEVETELVPEPSATNIQASESAAEPSITNVQEFIDSLPTVPAPEAASKPQAPEKPPEKPVSDASKPSKLTSDKDGASPKSPIPKVVDPSKPTSDKAATSSKSPIQTAGEKTWETSKIKPSNKPAKKPAPTKPNADVAADSTPVLEFLRQRLKDPKSADQEPPSKPPPLKLSLSAVQKTNAAITNILESTEKSSGKSPSIFDALNIKHEEPAAPSLKLSLSSSPHAETTPMDVQTLMTEMNTRLIDGKHAEAAKLFETWKATVNPESLEANKPDRALYNLYMQAKVKTGAVFKELSQVLNEMENVGLPRDLAGYNILIRALFRTDPSLNRSSEAEAILERMEKEEPHAQPDADSYNLVVVLCALDRKTMSAFKHMKTMIDKGFEPSRTTVNEVLLASARTHQTQLGASILKELKATGKQLAMLNTCVELLMAASEVDDAECARLALNEISEKPMARFGPKMILDEGTMICVLGTAARTNDDVLGKMAWDAIVSHTKGLARVPSSDSFLARLHGLTATNGKLGEAFKTTWEFEACYPRKSGADSEMFSPFTSLKCLSAACSRGGPAALDAAYYKVEEAHTKKQGVALASLNCIIMGCSNLWDSERAFQTFEAIENVFGLRPDLHSCNALLHALGRTKMTEDALKVYEYIKEAGFKPNEWTYMLLTEAHVVNHDANSALNTLQTMIDAGHRPLRQTVTKVWTRLKQYEEHDGLDRLRQMETQLSYRHSHFGNNRRKIMVDLIRGG